MYNEPKHKVFAFILARGGSKGVPRKNVRLLNGKPLIAWTIEAALRTPEIIRVFVSTEDDEIATVSRAFGAEVLHRPAELAEDSSLAHPVFMHHLLELANQGEVPDVVVDLRPTSPLRSAQRIREGIALLLQSDRERVDSVRAVMRATKHPYKMWRMNDSFLEPFLDESQTGMKEPFDACRESLPEVFQNNGAMYAIWPRTILEKGTMTGTKVVGYLMEEWESVNIDTEIDFQLAELLMQSHLVQ